MQKLRKHVSEALGKGGKEAFIITGKVYRDAKEELPDGSPDAIVSKAIKLFDNNKFLYIK